MGRRDEPQTVKGERDCGKLLGTWVPPPPLAAGRLLQEAIEPQQPEPRGSAGKAERRRPNVRQVRGPLLGVQQNLPNGRRDLATSRHKLFRGRLENPASDKMHEDSLTALRQPPPPYKQGQQAT